MTVQLKSKFSGPSKPGPVWSAGPDGGVSNPSQGMTSLPNAGFDKKKHGGGHKSGGKGQTNFAGKGGNTKNSKGKPIPGQSSGGVMVYVINGHQLALERVPWSIFHSLRRGRNSQGIEFYGLWDPTMMHPDPLLPVGNWSPSSLGNKDETPQTPPSKPPQKKEFKAKVATNKEENAPCSAPAKAKCDVVASVPNHSDSTVSAVVLKVPDVKHQVSEDEGGVLPYSSSSLEAQYAAFLSASSSQPSSKEYKKKPPNGQVNATKGAKKASLIKASLADSEAKALGAADALKEHAEHKQEVLDDDGASDSDDEKKSLPDVKLAAKPDGPPPVARVAYADYKQNDDLLRVEYLYKEERRYFFWRENVHHVFTPLWREANPVVDVRGPDAKRLELVYPPCVVNVNFDSTWSCGLGWRMRPSRVGGRPSMLTPRYVSELVNAIAIPLVRKPIVRQTFRVSETLLCHIMSRLNNLQLAEDAILNRINQAAASAAYINLPFGDTKLVDNTKLLAYARVRQEKFSTNMDFPLPSGADSLSDMDTAWVRSLSQRSGPPNEVSLSATRVVRISFAEALWRHRWAVILSGLLFLTPIRRILSSLRHRLGNESPLVLPLHTLEYWLDYNNLYVRGLLTIYRLLMLLGSLTLKVGSLIQTILERGVTSLDSFVRN